eukprot:evm.model.scf_57.2 EVM.evm.TU.scf_57.2   scf_57:15109-21501(+)
MRPPAALAALLCLLAGEARVSAQSLSGPLTCKCTDVDPRFGDDKHLKVVKGLCFEHFLKGNCQKGFMWNTIDEITEGFTVQDVESNSKWARVLGEALKFSVLKADPDLRAVYTEAFLHDGMELATEFDDHQRLKVQKDGGGTVKFVGPMGSATVLEWDKPSCKGYIHIVDEYLVPSADFGTYLEDVTDVGETEGYCETATSKQYDGQLVDTKQTQSPGDCCRKCKKNKDCTVWTFCAKPSGCQERNSPIIPWGTCHLLFDVALTQGRNPTTIRSDELTPYHSGVFRR